MVSKYIYKRRPSNNQIITYLFGYEEDNPSAEYLRYRIFQEPYSGSISETYYTKNLKYAKKFFREKLENLYAESGLEAIAELYLKLTLHLMFNVHEINDDYDVFVAFETMNNRGKKLSNLELLKNRLIYLTTLYPDKKFDELDKAYLRKQINDAWKEVYYQLGRNEHTALSDDDFLKAHWISYFSYSRKKGDDYIQFLLNKFSANNIFEKRIISVEEECADVEEGYLAFDDDDEVPDTTASKTEELKLEPDEISSYVNSLKEMAKFWYDTFFPYESSYLNDEEKLWVDRLNRISIGYYRPIVMVLLSRRDLKCEKRIEAFSAIERFIFICFRMGYFNGTFKSSEYYRMARSISRKEIGVDDLIDDIHTTLDVNMEYALSAFINKIKKHFENGDGFYDWKSIKYFLFEYELQLAQMNKLDKMSWKVFYKTEKDKLSIEHILPQTPTNYYWRNQFRQFETKEVKLLSGALGNLLPLSQSINSALQNDSFIDKKTSKTNGRRGYENGSHSEIEVSKETDWTAERIYNRSIKLLDFLQCRWQITLTSEQMEKLVYVNFVVDGRAVKPELPPPVSEENNAEVPQTHKGNESETSDLEAKQIQFWTAFVEYCKKQGRGEDIASRKPVAVHWYDIPIEGADFNLSFTITWGKYLTLLIYAFNQDAFIRLESKKKIIETEFGDSFDWYSSREGSIAKRILYKKEFDIFDLQKQEELFQWMIEKYDALCAALEKADEVILNRRG